MSYLLHEEKTFLAEYRTESHFNPYLKIYIYKKFTNKTENLQQFACFLL
jgi:hypothetical protein